MIDLLFLHNRLKVIINLDIDYWQSCYYKKQGSEATACAVIMSEGTTVHCALKKNSSSKINNFTTKKGTELCYLKIAESPFSNSNLPF